MIKEIVVANKNYASIVVSPSEHLDSTAIKVIRQDCPPFLMPMRLVRINNEIQIRFEISGGIRMSYMPMQMKKRDMNQLLQQMLLPFEGCMDWFLDYHNIYLDSNYIMVEQENFKIKYIYLPYEKTIQTEEEIMAFFGNFVMGVELQDDPAYIATLLRCIMGKDASITALSHLVKDSIKEVRNTIPPSPQLYETQPQNENISPVENWSNRNVLSNQPMQENKKVPDVIEKEFGKNDLASSIEMGLFGESTGKNKKEKKEKKQNDFLGKLFGSDKKSKKEQPRVNVEVQRRENYQQEAAQYNAYTVAQVPADDDVEEKTVYMEAEEPISDGLCMKLESSGVDNVPERIELSMDQGYAVLGRFDKSGKLSADFNFDRSLSFIGRRHVRFEKAGGDFYIIDLESKNHTYLNGEELLPNRRYLLKQGDRVTITSKYGITYRIC